MNPTSNTDRVSSSASTGGAGTFFEQHVDAYWLALLLVRGIPPILHDCTVDEVHLQTEHLGWHTDDFLVVGKNGSEQLRKLAGQVKQTFTVSAANDECKKALQDFWKDFKNPQQFSPDSDRFVLVTLRGTDTLLRHFSGLLDCSRASRDEGDFEHRLNTPGFIDKRAVRYCNEIQKIVGEAEDRNVSLAEVWPFLRVLHVQSLDLDTPTAQAEGMIKSLLAHTAGNSDAMGVADATWNALLREASKGMSEARSYQRCNLPEELIQLHKSLSDTEHRALDALRDHSEIILGKIHSTIGDLHLERDSLVQQVMEHLESNQIVLISGAAGSGKSVIAKDTINLLAADHFVFSFRAEEFAHPHMDQTLQNIQIPVNAAKLGTILASQDRKVLLIESIERLLEKSTRDAFTDLLTLMAKDKSWRLLLTCRDYAVDLVRTAFLSSTTVGHSVVVPPLDNEELEKVQKHYPQLARPLANPELRRVLSNPYILDMALRIQWSEQGSLPQSEREFRDLFWREIVRAEHRSPAGMSQRREKTFVEVSLRRARALTLYANCGDLNSKVVENLRHDSLIMRSQESDSLLAPAHDVMEDWAILHWIQDQHVIHEGSLQKLSAEIGGHPAVRRTYRKWVTELVESIPDTADDLFKTAICGEGIPDHFRDDTLISLLRSSSSSALLERQKSELFANDNQPFLRVIHLLRVACVTPNTGLSSLATLPSLFNMPDGAAWACVVKLAATHLDSFAEKDRIHLLRLIEDWVRGVSLQNPYPDGAEAVARIAHWLLSHITGYGSNDYREKILQVIAKIPNADSEGFSALLRGSDEYEGQYYTTKNLQKIIFEELDGAPAARDMPDLIVSVAKDYLLISESDLAQRREYHSFVSIDIEPLFGLKDDIGYNAHLASADCGPFLPLLRNHSNKGLDLIMDVFNHSTEWYAHPREGCEDEAVEPPFEMELIFSDGTSRKQWVNPRLWNLYRGTSVGPDVLQCILMALEHWLLEYAEAHPDELDPTLLNILQRSNSGALTAVVASVATAFPHSAGETLLVLLRSRLCILLDRQRLVDESQTPTIIADFFPSFNALNKTYKQERKQADKRPHRRRNLEAAIIELQSGSFISRIHEILDQHRAEMPPVEEQNEDDRIWRLAVHRMDIRQYSVAENAAEIQASLEGSDPSEDSQNCIYLELNDPDPDLKEMMEQSSVELGAIDAKLRLQNWGRQVFENSNDATYDSDQWRQKLQEARDSETGGEDNNELYSIGGPAGPVFYSMLKDGAGFVAAVCVRDHWDEMSAEERKWCVGVICSEVNRQCNNWENFARVQRSMSSDRGCAGVLPLLIEKSLSDDQQACVHQTLVVALTHAINEVRSYAILGIGQYLWTIDRELALHCVNALAKQVMLVQHEVISDSELREKSGGGWKGHFWTRLWASLRGHRRQAKFSYNDRRSIDEIEAKVASIVRKRFNEVNWISEDDYRQFGPAGGFELNRPNIDILRILEWAPTESVAIEAFERLAHKLVKGWDTKENQSEDRIDPHTEVELEHLLQNFLLRTSLTSACRILQPILDATERHPREVYKLVRGLVSLEDRQPNTSQFWSIWKLFADRVRQAQWLERVDDQHAAGAEMISAIFLGNWWKEGIRHWKSLEDYAEHIHLLFADLPPSSTVLDAYVQFLYKIGEQSLPDAFIRIATQLKEGDPKQMIKKENTVFCLEVLLQRYVYWRPLELKRQKDLREAVLFLLDLLVESGSSAAFRMRDDFVTPISNT